MSIRWERVKCLMIGGSWSWRTWPAARLAGQSSRTWLSNESVEVRSVHGAVRLCLIDSEGWAVRSTAILRWGAEFELHMNWSGSRPECSINLYKWHIWQQPSNKTIKLWERHGLFESGHTSVWCCNKLIPHLLSISSGAHCSTTKITIA